MKKIVSVSVRNIVESGVSKEYKHKEFTELNELLNDGWTIHSKEIINSNVVSVFTIVYNLEK